MKSFNRIMFPGRGEHAQYEPESRIYSRSPIGMEPAKPRNLSKHPVISILLRIDELKQRDEARRGLIPQADRTLQELEACLAAIQEGAN